MEPGMEYGMYLFQHQRVNYVTTPTSWTRLLIDMLTVAQMFCDLALAVQFKGERKTGNVFRQYIRYYLVYM